jgi:aspartate/methionine/tyrosine aminotransferase
MTQKSELLAQDLTIRNKLDEINKEVIELDAKLYKLINPTEPTGAIAQVDSFIQSQA